MQAKSTFLRLFLPALICAFVLAIAFGWYGLSQPLWSPIPVAAASQKAQAASLGAVTA